MDAGFEMTDQPELDLGRLLASIDPELQGGTYLFCSLEWGALDRGQLPPGLTLQMLFREPEGTTVVVPSDEASAAGLVGSHPSEWIRLGARSDLAAVGFLAEITARLARAGISANVVSAFHHDHVFVPVGRGPEAVAVLEELQGEHRDRLA
jgi:uncharacterized protein